MVRETNDERKLAEIIEPLVRPLGCELVAIEALTQRQKILRVFIERTDRAPVGVEDCARVSRALDIPLEGSDAVNAIFRGAYELEVSSPGLERPLRKLADFERFRGSSIRAHLYRPLEAAEMDNATYFSKNPRQKNFSGLIADCDREAVFLEIGGERVRLPFDSISKANLEWRDGNERH